MIPAHAMVYLSQKPSTEYGQFRFSVLVLAGEAPAPLGVVGLKAPKHSEPVFKPHPKRATPQPRIFHTLNS